MTVMLKTSLQKIFLPGLLTCLWVALASNAWGTAQTWTAGNGTWLTGANGWNGTATWANGDTANFAGSDGGYAITVGGSISPDNGSAATPAIKFSNSGYTLSASSAQTITINNGGNKVSYLGVASGKTATVGNNVTIAKTAGNNGINFLGGGTLVIGTGGTISHANNNANAVEGGTTVQVNGGTFNCGSSLVVGQLTTGEGLNGTFTLNTGSVSLGTYGGAVGNLNVGRTAGDVSFANLNGGTITCYAITWTAGTGTVNFNGATVKARTNANSAFMPTASGLTTYIQSGGVIFDNYGQALTVAQPLLAGTGAGGLTLNDSAVTKGTFTLNATETYTGPTVVAAGTLALSSTASLNANSVIGIAPGATFDVSAQSTFTFGSGSSLLATGSVSSASFIKGGTTISLNGQPATLNFAPTGVLGDSAHPALTVTAGTLSLGSSSIKVINNGGSPLGAGDYTLINVSGAGAISGTPTLDSSSGVGAGTGMAASTAASLVVSSGSLVLHVTSSLATTTTTIALHTGWTSTSTYGDALQLNVSVTGASPTGTVTVKDGGASGVTIGSATLSGGAAVVTVSPLNSLTAGTHANIVAVYGGDSNNGGSSSSALSLQTVNQKALTLSGAAAVGKCYDGATTGASVTGTLVGVVGSDVVTLVGSGTFANAGPGAGIGVTSTSTLGGAAAANYSLTQPTGLTANIVSTATWNVATGGTWETNANWLNNIVATNSGNTADFSTVNLTSDAIITNSGAKTIGNLIFGDTDTSTPAGWTLSGSTLTLDATTPTIAVNALGAGKNVTINSILAGSAGLTKTGNGTLQLNGINTYSGGTVVKAGTVNFGADSGFGAVPGSATPGNITLDGGGIALTGNNQNLNSNRGILVTTNGGSISNALVSTANLGVSSIIDGPGTLTVGVASQAGVIINGANTYTGGTVFAGAANGNIFCMASSAGPAGAPTSGTYGTGPVTFNGPGTRSTTSGDITVGNPIVFAADTAFPTLASEKSLTFSGPVTITNGTRTLTVNIGATVSGKSLMLAGAVGDNGSGYGLTKAGTGVLNLSGTNTYSGPTTVGAGTLALSGSISNTPNIAVGSGATFDVSAVSGGYVLGSAQSLSGKGTVAGAVTSDGTVAPGNTNVGTLTFSSNLAINGNLLFKVNTSLAQSNDVISVVGVLANSGTGTLTVTNIGTNALVVGDYFKLFSQPLINGGALTIAGPAGTTFTNNLAVDGSISVLTIPPTTPPTLSFTNLGGGSLQFSWTGGGKLQAQTNNLSTGLNTNWGDYPGGTTPPVSVTIDPGQGSVFFRVKQ